MLITGAVFERKTWFSQMQKMTYCERANTVEQNSATKAQFTVDARIWGSKCTSML